MERDKLLENPEVVLFSGAKRFEPGEVELHNLSSVVGNLFGRSLKDVKSDWEKVSRQIKNMLEGVIPETPEGFNLENVEVSLGFSAGGRIVFIAEAGIEASISITFKRR